jgi:hypothetical protein
MTLDNEITDDLKIIPADFLSNAAFNNRIESLIEKYVCPLDEEVKVLNNRKNNVNYEKV